MQKWDKKNFGEKTDVFFFCRILMKKRIEKVDKTGIVPVETVKNIRHCLFFLQPDF